MTRLDLDQDTQVITGQTNVITINVDSYSNPGGGGVDGNDLWKLTTFLSSNPVGTGPKNVLDEQILTPSEASTSLESGQKLGFNNMAVVIEPEDLQCNPPMYLCAELSRGLTPSTLFTVEGSREDSMIDCKLLECQRRKLPALL